MPITYDEDVDPRIKEYLKEQALRQERISSPEYQRSLGVSNLARNESARNQQDLASYSKAFSKLGTLGGKSSETGTLQDAADANNKRQQLADADRAEDARRRQEAGEKRFGLDMKVADYVQGRRDKNTALAIGREDRDSQARAAQQAKREERSYQESRDQNQYSRMRGRDEDLFKNSKEMENIKSQNELELTKARGLASPKPVGIGKQDQEANYRYISLKNSGEQLRNLVETEGTASFTGPQAAQMDSLIYQMAVDYAKLVDPESVAREGEVASAQKYMLPFRENGGLTTKNSTAKAQIDSYLKGLDARLAARDAAKAGDLDAKTYSEDKPKQQPGTAYAAEPQGPPKAGDVVDGYKFLGGDPSDPKSWEQQ